MSPPSQLIKGGLLFEGSDFAAWRERIISFVNHRLGVDEEGDTEANLHDERKEFGLALIQVNISRALFSRVPSDNRKHPERLLSSLENLAKPFRFSDLPGIVRGLAYGET